MPLSSGKRRNHCPRREGRSIPLSWKSRSARLLLPGRKLHRRGEGGSFFPLLHKARIAKICTMSTELLQTTDGAPLDKRSGTRREETEELARFSHINYPPFARALSLSVKFPSPIQVSIKKIVNYKKSRSVYGIVKRIARSRTEEGNHEEISPQNHLRLSIGR